MLELKNKAGMLNVAFVLFKDNLQNSLKAKLSFGQYCTNMSQI